MIGNGIDITRDLWGGMQQMDLLDGRILSCDSSTEVDCEIIKNVIGCAKMSLFFEFLQHERVY